MFRTPGTRPTVAVAPALAPALAVVLAVVLTGCGSSGTQQQGTDVPAVPVGDALNLTQDCPSTVVIQGGWFPTADIGLPFQLFGGKYTPDPAKARVSGPLVVGGKATGITLEFRSGGPIVSYINGPTLAKTDPSITMVFTNIDEMVALSANAPMQAVMAPVNGDPQSIIWDPATYPQFNSLSDIGQTDTRILYSQNAQAAFGYLVGGGLLRSSQLDGSYDSSPSQFIAAKGTVAVQGYSTNEVYVYEHSEKWRKPVAHALLQDSGYPNYAGVLAIRPQDKTRLTPCLRKLVPILQQAAISMWTDPTAAADRIVTSVAAFNDRYAYGAGNAQFGFCQLQKEGLVGNPKTGPIGTLEPTKVQRVLDILRPIFGEQRDGGTLPGLKSVPVPAGLDAAALATNEFLDPSLRLPDTTPRYYSTCPTEETP